MQCTVISRHKVSLHSISPSGQIVLSFSQVVARGEATKCRLARQLAHQRLLTGHSLMPHYDITAGHYYGQLMTAAHASCCWPAAARFTELGIVTGYRPSC